MKRIISFVLSAAMLLTLLSVSVSAAEISSLTLDFDPCVGDEILAVRNYINAAMDSDTDPHNCKLEYRITGTENINAFQSRSFTSTSELQTFCGEGRFPTEASAYENQQYLFVFSVWIDDNTAANSINITAGANSSGRMLFVDIDTLYFSLLFTPNAAGSNNNGNDGDENEFTSNGNTENSTTNGGLTTNIGANGSSSAEVTVISNAAEEEQVIYSVDISWGSMEFTYTPAFVGVWDPTTHAYKDSTKPSWTHENTANMIKVTNHSNEKVDATFTFSAADGYSGITGKFYESDSDTSKEITVAKEIRSAVGSDVDEAPFVIAYLHLSGIFDGNTGEAVKCGVVTVNIS